MFNISESRGHYSKRKKQRNIVIYHTSIKEGVADGDDDGDDGGCLGAGRHRMGGRLAGKTGTRQFMADVIVLNKKE